MLTYLVDDRGSRGEYAHFLQAHGERLPPLSLEVFCTWTDVAQRLQAQRPDLVLLDMHFDETAPEALCGDLDALASSARFGGDRVRAEAQLRRLQGVFILQALRRLPWHGPAVLFGSLPPQQAERLLDQHGPLRIVEGLIFDAVREALLWAAAHD